MNSFPYQIGQTADNILDIVKRTGRRLIHRAIIIGREKQGLIVLWFYQDATLTLKRRKGCYRVTQIKPASTPDELVELSKKHPMGPECPKCHSPLAKSDLIVEGRSRYFCFRCGFVTFEEE